MLKYNNSLKNSYYVWRIRKNKYIGELMINEKLECHNVQPIFLTSINQLPFILFHYMEKLRWGKYALYNTERIVFPYDTYKASYQFDTRSIAVNYKDYYYWVYIQYPYFKNNVFFGYMCRGYCIIDYKPDFSNIFDLPQIIKKLIC